MLAYHTLSQEWNRHPSVMKRPITIRCTINEEITTICIIIERRTPHTTTMTITRLLVMKCSICKKPMKFYNHLYLRLYEVNFYYHLYLRLYKVSSYVLSLLVSLRSKIPRPPLLTSLRSRFLQLSLLVSLRKIFLRRLYKGIPTVTLIRAFPLTSCYHAYYCMI